MYEGRPIVGEIKENDPKYYRFSINNPDVTKITISLTTIHGDPDIFVSRNVETPSYM